MIEAKHKDFTRLNKLFITSIILLFGSRYIISKLLDYLFKTEVNYYISLSLAILISYLPYFIENNFRDNSQTLVEKYSFEKKDYLTFAIIILFANVFSYFFTMGIESSFNELGLTILKHKSQVNSVEGSISLVFYSVILAPIIEELIYRSFMIRKLKNYGKYFSIVISSLLFALMHANISQFISSFFLGLILAYVFLITNSLKAVIILHMLNNAYTSLYNELIYKHLKGYEGLQLFIIIELALVTILSIYSFISIKKNSKLKIKDNKELTSSLLSYRMYFLRITSILIVIVFLIFMIISIDKLGG